MGRLLDLGFERFDFTIPRATPYAFIAHISIPLLCRRFENAIIFRIDPVGTANSAGYTLALKFDTCHLAVACSTANTLIADQLTGGVASFAGTLKVDAI